MKLSLDRQTWVATAAFLPLHSMSWEQLRATVVYERSRRTWAWGEMLSRSERCKSLKSPPLRDFRRNHGG